jgi:hypothetical protein|nr:MAG TPA: hypothetical protein [Bacteriophage sp.]
MEVYTLKEETNKIGHLNMIQEIITRMGNNSFSLKQWSVGIMVAIYAFAGESSHKAVIVTIIPLIVFWLLDAYYLMLERKFRCLYDEVRIKKEEEIDFDMSFKFIRVKMSDVKKYCFFKILFSKTIWPFYIVCILTTLIIYFIKF